MFGLENFVDVSLVFGIVFFIEFIKRTLKSFKVTIPDDAWKLIVFVFGTIGAVIVEGIAEFKNFSVFMFMKEAFIYSAYASIVYQTGKLGLKTLKGKTDDEDIPIND